MRAPLFGFFILLLFYPIAGPGVRPHKRAVYPLLVMIQHNPWINSTNSDEPDLIVYNNGDVICKEITAKYHCHFHKYQLSAFGRDSFNRCLKIYADSLRQAPTHINLYADRKYQVPDQPQSQFYIFAPHKKPIYFDVYGELAVASLFKALPRPIQNPLKYWLRLKNDAAPAWQPDSIELMLWPFAAASKIKNWTGAVKTYPVQAGSFSYTETCHFPVHLEDSLSRFLSGLGDGEAIGINGKPYGALYRYILPGEAVWRHIPKMH